MVQISAKDKSHAAPDSQAGSMHGFLCSDFPELFQHPPISASFPDPVPEIGPWGAVSPYLVILTKRRCPLQNWCLRTDTFTEGDQL